MSDEMVVENPNRTEQLISELASVWEASVKATHMFLNERDIIALRSFVETGIKEVDNLIVAYENQKPIGFMGIAQGKLKCYFLNQLVLAKV